MKSMMLCLVMILSGCATSRVAVSYNIERREVKLEFIDRKSSGSAAAENGWRDRRSCEQPGFTGDGVESGYAPHS